VDTVSGVVHHETYRRRQLIELVSSLGLRETSLYDLFDNSDDPKSPDISAELNPVFERYIQRAEGHPDLQSRGGELRQRVAEVGFHSASTLVIVGKKNQFV